MLKRSIGRFLIMLLVITGLAGTIKENSLTNAERKYATGLMKETYKNVLATVKGVSESQLNFKPTAERWSVKECIYHIAATEKGLWDMFEAAMKLPPNPEKRSEIKVTDADFVAMVKDRTKKAQAPEPFQPKNIKYQSFNEALTDFKHNRHAHIKYIKNSTEDLRNHVVQLPFAWVDCYQLYLMIAAHSNRHTQQIEEVMASPGYPAK